MRDIKFRGLSAITHQFKYGYFWETSSGVKYITNDISFRGDIWDLFEILPESLGQFTGLLDKNGKEIYEGDLIQNDPIKEQGKPWVVEFTTGFFGAKGMALRAMIGIEVIGNIYENPELITT